MVSRLMLPAAVPSMRAAGEKVPTRGSPDAPSAPADAVGVMIEGATDYGKPRPTAARPVGMTEGNEKKSAGYGFYFVRWTAGVATLLGCTGVHGFRGLRAGRFVSGGRGRESASRAGCGDHAYNHREEGYPCWGSPTGEGESVAF